MKTPEEMYYEWRQAFDESLDDNICAGKPIIPLTTDLGMMTFLAGYKAAMGNSLEKPDGLNSLNNSNGWISVKDRLPELGKDVLVLGNEGSIEVRAQALRKIAPLQKYPYSWINTWGESEDYTVTHWMEIPEPPKEEK